MLSILVASGTANTGSKVVQQLSESGKVNVRALVRNPESDAAKAIAALPNVTLVKGDYNDPASLKAALVDIERAFLVSAPGEDAQYDREVAFLAAAKEANIDATVRISTADVLIHPESTGVYAKAHGRIEQYIEQHKCKCIDLRPNWFMSNLLMFTAALKGSGKLPWPVAGDHTKTPFVDTRDVASAATAILLLPKAKLDEFVASGHVQVHGPAPTNFAENVAAVNKATGKDFSIEVMDPDAWVAMMVGWGISEYFARSFKDTILICAGAMEPKRAPTHASSPLLLSVWQPKYSVDDWAKDNAAAFL